MTSAALNPKISSTDRFSFTLMLAIATHAVLILGLGFEYIKAHTAPPSTIEVVLTKTKNDAEAEDPKVIAENNQIQSGSVDFDSRPTAPSVTKKSLQGSDETTEEKVIQKSSQTIANEMYAFKENPDAVRITDQQADQHVFDINQESIQRKQQNLARLISELNEQEQQYAKRPRINHIDTLSAKTAIEAKYIKEWVEKVEIVGNINYPSQARDKSFLAL